MKVLNPLKKVLAAGLIAGFLGGDLLISIKELYDDGIAEILTSSAIVFITLILFKTITKAGAGQTFGLSALTYLVILGMAYSYKLQAAGSSFGIFDFEFHNFYYLGIFGLSLLISLLLTLVLNRKENIA